MTMETLGDSELLKVFSDSRSERAFRILVERHLNHVHSVACRVTCNHDLARDVSQQVFTKLAARHRTIPRGLSLPAWLHTTTRSLAIDLVRSEEARRRRESEFEFHSAMNAPDPDDWSSLAPVIDAAVDSLPAADREAILLRYYQKRSHAEVGRTLHLGEDAARMRINRALEKLRSRLARRGIATTAAALAITLPAHAVGTVPAALAASVSTTALAATAAGTLTATSGLTSLLAMTKAHLATVAVLVIAVPIIAVQYSRNSRLSSEATSLRASLDAFQGLPATGPGSGAGPLSSRPEAATADAAAMPPSDPASLRLILAQSDPMTRIRSLLAFAENLSSRDIGAAVEELQSAPEWDAEAKMLAHILFTRMAREDPDAAYAGLSNPDPKYSKNGLSNAASIFASLASADPLRAAKWLSDPDNKLAAFPLVGDVLAGSLTKEWVRQDPAAALAWAKSVPENQRAGAYTGILGSLASTDPAAAASLSAQLDPGEARTGAVASIAKSWARQDPETALAWVRSLAGDERGRAMGQAVGGWAEANPAAAAAYVDQLKDTADTGGLLSAVATPWAVKAPSEAAAWVAGQSDGKDKNDAMGRVMWNWTTSDPVKASSWLVEQPDSPARDAGIAGLSKAAFPSDPEGAVTWASDISDEGFRNLAVGIGLREWQKKSPAAASDWATRNGVPLPQHGK